MGGCQRSDERRLRILTAGLSHESDTFCPIQTEEKDFTVARGAEALKEKEWAQFLQKAGVELIPTLHASASPFGVVSRGTYEKFKREILDGVRKAALGRSDSAVFAYEAVDCWPSAVDGAIEIAPLSSPF